MTPRRSNPAPPAPCQSHLPALQGRGPRPLLPAHQPTRERRRNERQHPPPCLPPTPLPCFPHESCYVLSRKAHGTSFFSLLFSHPSLSCSEENHCDAKIMPIIRSEAPPVVTLSLSLPGLLRHHLMLLLGQCCHPVFPWLACLLPAEEAAVPEPHHPRGLHRHTHPPTCQAQTSACPRALPHLTQSCLSYRDGARRCTAQA